MNFDKQFTEKLKGLEKTHLSCVPCRLQDRTVWLGSLFSQIGAQWPFFCTSRCGFECSKEGVAGFSSRFIYRDDCREAERAVHCVIGRKIPNVQLGSFQYQAISCENSPSGLLPAISWIWVTNVPLWPVKEKYSQKGLLYHFRKLFRKQTYEHRQYR